MGGILACVTEPDVDAALVVDVFARNCASRDLLADVAGKWSVLALLALDEGGYRFNALRRRVEGVSEKMLAQGLQILERDGWVHREVRSTIPPHVEYRLTGAGAELVPHLLGLIGFVEERMPAVHAARAAVGEVRPSR